MEQIRSSSRRMDAQTISKRGRSLKTQMSRGNLLRNVCLPLLVACIFISGCSGSGGGRSSSHSLAMFKERFNEAYKEESSAYSLAYATSSHSLEKFKARFNEAYKEESSAYSLAYATSTHSLEKFKARFNEAYKEESSAYSLAYAGS